jgi:hypothetical protein
MKEHFAAELMTPNSLTTQTDRATNIFVINFLVRWCGVCKIFLLQHYRLIYNLIIISDTAFAVLWLPS